MSLHAPIIAVVSGAHCALSGWLSAHLQSTEVILSIGGVSCLVVDDFLPFSQDCSPKVDFSLNSYPKVLASTSVISSLDKIMSCICKPSYSNSCSEPSQ
jgi:hypothetical protein